MNDACKRRIKQKERYLNKKCRKMWVATNPLGETYLFGSFVANRTDKTLVTIAQYVPAIGQFVPV